MCNLHNAISTMQHSKIYKLQIIFSLCLVTTVWLLLEHRSRIPRHTPSAGVQASVFDYSNINSVKQKKQLFFDLLRPLVQQENQRLEALRNRLMTVEPEERDSDWVTAVADRYNIDDPTSDSGWQELMHRVDIIPLELVLAQAAMESGWGESRFARQGNNLFGQWCFTEGCGLVPRQRPEGSSHEVRRFDSINDALVSYIHNLNIGHAYEELRRMRFSSRQENRVPDGQTLAAGLSRYSEKGALYVDQIRQVMRINHRLIHGTQP